MNRGSPIIAPIPARAASSVTKAPTHAALGGGFDFNLHVAARGTDDPFRAA
jgi:hypothetical protein